MQQITDHVFVETGFRGCNTGFVVTTQGIVVIDTPMVPHEAKKWRDAAAGHGPIRYVINTEPHADHASGNCWFAAAVVAHEGTRQALLQQTVQELEKMLRRNDPDSLPLDPAFYFRLPEITFSQNLTLHLGQHTFELINMPGHTMSETAVYLPEEKVVFTGDNLNLMTPIFVKSEPHRWLESLQRLQQLDVERYVPGHGNVAGKDCIPAMAAAIAEWLELVKAAIAQGLSIDETIAKVTPLKDPTGADPFMKEVIRMNVTDLFRSLRGGR